MILKKMRSCLQKKWSYGSGLMAGYIFLAQAAQV